MKEPKTNQVSNPWSGKIAVVTGASSGIGAATSRKLASEGLRVVLAARREAVLASLAAEINQAGGEAEIMCGDMSQEEDRLRLFERIEAKHGPIDVLINNAGFGWYGYFADMPWPTALEMIQVNSAAVAHLSSLFLPQMKGRNAGHIINVSSIAGGLPSQGVAMYSATKSFLDAFTTALHRELRGSNVHASVVRPGPVSTGFFKSAEHRAGGRSIPSQRLGISAERVADRIWKLMRKPRRVAYIPWFLGIVPWIEAGFGWLMDLLGPLLLRNGVRPL
jgi:short-subunit dehydrogenase